MKIATVKTQVTIAAFQAGKFQGKLGDISNTAGNIFYSYDTAIAFKRGNGIVLNKSKYSKTTTNQQKALREYFEIVEELEEEDFNKALNK